jgi:four helix bundle protein
MNFFAGLQVSFCSKYHQVIKSRVEFLGLTLHSLNCAYNNMKYSRFEELPVWKDSIELAIRIYNLTTKGAFKGRYSLKDQIERASVSISNNIAEGFERGTTQETLTFLYIARGSDGETRSALVLCERLSGFEDLKSEISDLKTRAESISRQLRRWAESLQNSDIRGQRYLTDRTRARTREDRERADFLKELEEIRTRKT